MRNNIVKIFILTVLSVLCFSCEKEEFYSCNPDADKWVKDNLNEVQIMKRSEWVNIDNITYQKAAFNAFTTKQRHELWIKKIDEVLVSNLTERERLHILLMSEEIKNRSQWFDDDLVEKHRDQMDLFTHKWIEIAKDTLNWTAQDIYSLIGTPETVRRDSKGNIRTTTLMYSSNVKNPGEGYGDVCDCGNDSEYLACPAISGLECKVTNECTVTERGCGAWWMNTCWGKCKKAKL